VALDRLIINRDDIPKRTQCSLVHGGFLSLSWLRVQPHSGPPALLIVRNIISVSRVALGVLRACAATPRTRHIVRQQWGKDVEENGVLTQVLDEPVETLGTTQRTLPRAVRAGYARRWAVSDEFSSAGAPLTKKTERHKSKRHAK
jgi:hypothetical protein